MLGLVIKYEKEYAAGGTIWNNALPSITRGDNVKGAHSSLDMFIAEINVESVKQDLAITIFARYESDRVKPTAL